MRYSENFQGLFSCQTQEDLLLQKFRSLSLKGKVSVFNTIDALERLAPNLKRKIRSVKRSKTDSCL